MQVHPRSASATPDSMSAYLNPGGSKGPFAVVDLAGVELYVSELADADALVATAVKARELLAAAVAKRAASVAA